MRSQTSDHHRSLFFILSVFVFGLAAGSECAFAADDKKSPRELGVIKPKQLTEISGIAASRKNRDVLWLHNDGDSRLVFAVNTSGTLAALVYSPVKIEDLEDIVIGPGPNAGVDYLYLGDIGDNDERRREIRVVRFAEPDLSEVRGGQVEIEAAEVFRLKYPHGPHDAEALIIDPVSGDLFVVTKARQNALIYACPAIKLQDDALATLELMGTLDFAEVSSGAIAPDGSRIILRREGQGWLWDRDGREAVSAALQRPPQKIPVRGEKQGPNGEAVSFSPDGRSYYTVSEGKKQVVCAFQLPALAASASPDR